MMRYGFSGTWSCRTTAGGGAAARAARARAAPPPAQAVAVRNVALRTAVMGTGARTCMVLPSALVRFTGCVVGRRAAGEPLAKRFRIVGQAPLLEDRQRHRPHAAFAPAGGETLLLQPGFELVRLGVGGDGPLEQLSLDREPDCVGGRIPLAAPPPPLRSVERG